MSITKKDIGLLDNNSGFVHEFPWHFGNHASYELPCFGIR